VLVEQVDGVEFEALEEGEVVDRGRFRTNPRGWRSGLLIYLQHGSPWKRERIRSGISEQLHELGHEVIVANMRELRAISHRAGSSTRSSAPADRGVEHQDQAV
jgi:transposase